MASCKRLLASSGRLRGVINGQLSYGTREAIDEIISIIPALAVMIVTSPVSAIAPRALLVQAEPLWTDERIDHVVTSQTSSHSFVRSEHGPFLRPGQGSQRHREQRRSRACPRTAIRGAAIWPARQRFTLDGREHDNRLAISWDLDVHRCDADSIDAVGWCSARRAGGVDDAPPNGLAVHPFAAFVVEASRRFRVPEHWIRAVVGVESDGE
jgi:hypothetical protein